MCRNETWGDSEGGERSGTAESSPAGDDGCHCGGLTLKVYWVVVDVSLEQESLYWRSSESGDDVIVPAQ